jgi:deazaflavin-dependent oxidoreductase (nitroreductase family)
MKLLFLLGNPFVILALRSPLHRIISGSFMLITVTGRKTGHSYTTPVNYVREGDTVTLVCRAFRRWWRNVEGGAPVTLRIRGRDWHGVARTVGAPGSIDPDELHAFYRRVSPTPVPRRVAVRMAPVTVLLQVRLDAAASDRMR